MREYSGIIKNWQIHNYNADTQVLTGTIVADFKDRWEPGMHMRSSKIDRIEDNVVYTRNSIYLLEGKEGDTTLGGGDWGAKVATIFY